LERLHPIQLLSKVGFQVLDQSSPGCSSSTMRTTRDSQCKNAFLIVILAPS
jgi:hypothetical protein